MEGGRDLARRLVELRREFDSRFAEAAGTGRGVSEQFLGIRAGDASYAIRLGEIAGLLVDRRTVQVPGPLPELIGLTGLRGKLLPVYSLALLLGSAAASAPRWFVVSEKEQVGLAFDRVEGYLLSPKSDLLASEAGPDAHCQETLRRGTESLGVISIPSILRTITRRVSAVRLHQEH